jgi:hypothetical protein
MAEKAITLAFFSMAFEAAFIPRQRMKAWHNNTYNPNTGVAMERGP